MSRLSTTKRVQILNLMVEGMSLRAASRVADVSINTVYKLVGDAGRACAAYHDVAVRDVWAGQLQIDEMWAFCYTRTRNLEKAKAPPAGAGDIWTWTALDRDSKLMVAWRVGDRSAETGYSFLRDLRRRLANRPAIVTDGYGVYPEAVRAVFGEGVDFTHLGKGQTREGASTSHVERSNLTLRMGNRRYTRHTNAHSKKISNHRLMLSLFFVHYNFVRIHSSVRCTPAMEAGLTKTLHDMEWLVGLIDAWAPE